MELNVTMVQRADTTANWERYNPILKVGQIGYDTNKKMFKIGDGSSTWTALHYYGERIDGGTYTSAT